jgi:hypothetical protein
LSILFLQLLVLDLEPSTLDFEEEKVGPGCFIAFSFRDRVVTIGDVMVIPRWRGETAWWGDRSWRGKTIWQGEERRQGLGGGVKSAILKSPLFSRKS